MRVVEEPRTVIDRVFISSDGLRFSTEKECLKHEATMNVQDSLVFKSCIRGLRVFDSERPAELYYLNNPEDVEIFKAGKSISDLSTDFLTCGPGWYMYSIDDYGDGPPSHYLWNYLNYEYEWEESFDNWKEEMRQAMFNFSALGPGVKDE